MFTDLYLITAIQKKVSGKSRVNQAELANAELANVLANQSRASECENFESCNGIKKMARQGSLKDSDFLLAMEEKAMNKFYI